MSLKRPLFCVCKDPDTKESCGKIMDQADDWFYEWYGMCRECYMKYNGHVIEIQKEMIKQKKTLDE